MSAFDRDNWPCFAWIAIGVIFSCAAISEGIAEVYVAKAEAEAASKALEMGYVQKIVENRFGDTNKVWVKPNCDCQLLIKAETVK